MLGSGDSPHEKVENPCALAQTLLLLVICAWIIPEAIARLSCKEVRIDASVWAFAVMATSIVVDVNRSTVLERAAAEQDSQSLEARLEESLGQSARELTLF